MLHARVFAGAREGAKRGARLHKREQQRAPPAAAGDHACASGARAGSTLRASTEDGALEGDFAAARESGAE